MQKLQLYIGTDRVEFFKDETVSLTQTIQNVRDIGKVFTEFTQTFSVPASKSNNIIFEHYYNYNIQNGFDARIKYSASLELNNLPFKEGKIKLEGVDLKNNVAHTYRITFYGNTVNLKDILSDSQLSSLTGLAEYNQIYSFDDVKAAMQYYQGTVENPNNIIVPLITHTDRMFYDSTNFQEYGNVYNGGDIGSSSNGVNWNQFKYAIRVKAIIDAIQSQVYSGGQTITFSDDFFNDETNLQFHNLFLWLHRKKGSVESAGQVSENFTQLNQLVNTACFPVGFCNYTFATPSNGILELHVGSGYNYQTSLTITPPAATSYSARVIRNGSEIVEEVTNVSTTTTFNAQRLNNSTYAVQISTAADATFPPNAIRWVVSYQLISGSSGGSMTYANSSDFDTTSDIDFLINQQIPQMTIINFLSGLFNMYNLTAYVDDAGVIVVRTLDSYYEAGSSIPINIDRYLDTEKSAVNVALPFKYISFLYKGLGTILAKQFKQLNNLGWGTLTYTLDGDIFDAPANPYKIELPFEHVMYERLYDAGQTSTTIQWGYFVDDNRESYFGEPLLFYPIRKELGTSLAIRDTSPDVKDAISNYFIPSNSLALDPTISKTNINFNSELNEYLANEDGSEALEFTDTLFENDYKKYIEEVFNTSRRLTKITAYLPMKIFYSLKLNDLIQLGQNNYKINSLTTNLTTGKTEFELLNYDIEYINQLDILLDALEARADYFENKGCTAETLNELKKIQ